MTKRTIKAAAGKSHVTLEAAQAAVRAVYRDPRTGKYVVAERGVSRARHLIAANAGRSGQRDTARRTEEIIRQEARRSR